MSSIGVGKRAVALLATGLVVSFGGVSFAGESTAASKTVSNETLLEQMKKMQSEVKQLRSKVKELESSRTVRHSRPVAGQSGIMNRFSNRAEAWFANYAEGDAAPNVSAPKSDGLSVGGQIRARWEGSENLASRDFDDRNHDGQEFTLLRTRVNLGFQVEDDLFAFIQLQDSRHLGEAGSTTGNLRGVDMKQAYVQFRNVMGQPLDLTVGRQSIGLGDERLIGRLEWDNYGRSYDGVLFDYTPCETTNIKAFAFKVDENFGPTNSSGSASRAVDNDEDLFGLYGSVRPLDEGKNDALVIEPYVLHYNNRDGRSSMDQAVQRITTYGVRSELKPNETTLSGLQGATFDLEYALQAGDNGDESHRAHALHAGASFQCSELDWRPKVKAEYNYASGDEDPNDTDSQGFINLFPTNHDKYGYMDLFNWTNMHNTVIGMEVFPSDGWMAEVMFHCFWLDATRGGLSGPRGMTAGAANTSDDVGKELDFRVKHNLTKRVTLESGYSHFFTGSFIRQNTNGRSDADWGYIQMLLDF